MAVAALVAVCAAGTAQAYRPFDLTDADVAKRQQIEVELGPAEFVGEGPEHSVRAPNLTVNYGFATGRELSLEGANLVALTPAPGEPHTSLEGLGIALKEVVRRGSLQDKAGPSLAVEGAIELPERGESHLGVAASLVASTESKRGSTHWNFEGGRLPEGRNAGSAGVIFESGAKFGVAPALELKLDAVNGAPTEHSAIVGLIYVPGVKTEYDVALRFARSGDEKRFEIRAGVTWQMSAHKLLEQAASVMGQSPLRRRRH